MYCEVPQNLILAMSGLALHIKPRFDPDVAADVMSKEACVRWVLGLGSWHMHSPGLRKCAGGGKPATISAKGRAQIVQQSAMRARPCEVGRIFSSAQYLFT